MSRKILLQTTYPPVLRLITPWDKAAGSQADCKLVAVEANDHEESSCTPSHTAMEESQAFDSSGQPTKPV